MKYLLAMLPILLLGGLGMWLDVDKGFKVPAVYWLMGSTGVLLSFVLAGLLGLLS